MTPETKDTLQGLLQGALLRIPLLSEARMTAEKTLAFLRVWHYLARAGVSGDYLEFGVFRGLSFSLSLRACAKFFPRGAGSPRFFAFDSFEGLPARDDARDSSHWSQGEYSAGMATFRKRIRAAASGRDVEVIPGFYEQSLTPDLYTKHAMGKAAFVTIDCDLYESTALALSFVTPLLQTGTVLFFDDWFLSGGDMQLGEPAACRDWLARNPDLSLVEFGNVSIWGRMFVVNRKKAEAKPASAVNQGAPV